MKERQGSNYAKFFSQTTHTYIKEGISMGLLLGGGDRAIIIKNTVSVLCQSDRHFLAFSDTTRNERHCKSNKNNS